MNEILIFDCIGLNSRFLYLRELKHSLLDNSFFNVIKEWKGHNTNAQTMDMVQFQIILTNSKGPAKYFLIENFLYCQYMK